MCYTEVTPEIGSVLLSDLEASRCAEETELSLVVGRRSSAGDPSCSWRELSGRLLRSVSQVCLSLSSQLLLQTDSAATHLHCPY